MGNILSTVNEALWKDHYKTKKMLNIFKFSKESIENKSIVTEGNENRVKNNKDHNKNNNKRFTRKQLIGFLLGPLLFFATLMYPITDLSFQGRGVLGMLFWLICWWVAEPLALGGTSLLPLVILPLLGAVSGSATAAAYGSHLNFLFLGGFAIALAMEKCKLHERIALSIIAFFSGSIQGVIMGILAAGFFISMWVSNTATSLMLLPIAIALSAKLVNLLKEEGNHTIEAERNITKAIILSVSYGCIIGGTATLVGTPPNVILAGFASELLGYEISFGKWMLFALPLCLISLMFCAFYLTRIGYRFPTKLKSGTKFITHEKEALGKISYDEKIVAIIFSVTVFFWLSRTILWSKFIPGISDTMIAIASAMTLYAWPTKDGGRILEADSFKKMPWSVLLMVGGGLAMAQGFTNTDLASWIGNQMLVFEGYSHFAVIAGAGFLALTMSQVAPNTATTTILVPIVASLATAVGMPPLVLMTVTALGASFAITLPIGTPNLAIVYGTGELTMNDMLKTGIALYIQILITMILFTYYIFPIIFKLKF